ncbi:hypothetical protein [Agarilytica rhodophyticola]|uniref:hypothetical protein n=1 Tax=Agarilytica rhodophyticola TaxID=1737490 RepID=UPI000B3476C7|nr:hypothetical protein [Agarilytica rhodophyticola]
MSNHQDHKDALAVSYLTLRRTVGILGISFPFILVLGNVFIFDQGFQNSLSAFYHTGMGDVFVGVLFAIGFFLFSYKGYTRVDDVTGDLACIFAIGVAVFPTNADCELLVNACFPRIISDIHVGFSVLFFATLAYFCLYLFTKSAPNKPATAQKLARNKIYTTCGCVMIVCMLLMGIHLTVVRVHDEQFLATYKPTFWLETIAIAAFGISWLVKGKTFLKDKN